MSGSTINLTEEDVYAVLRRNGVDFEFVSQEQLDRIFDCIESEEDRVLSGKLYFDDPEQIKQFAHIEIANILREKGILEVKPALAVSVSGACLINSEIYDRYNKIRGEIEKLEKFGNVSISQLEETPDHPAARQISVDIHEAAIDNINAVSQITDALSEISKRAILGGSFQVNFLEQGEHLLTHQREIASGIVPAKLEVIDFGYGSDGDEKFAERTYKDQHGDYFTIRRDDNAETKFSLIGPYHTAATKAEAEQRPLAGENWAKVEPEMFKLLDQKLEQTEQNHITPKM